MENLAYEIVARHTDRGDEPTSNQRLYVIVVVAEEVAQLYASARGASPLAVERKKPNSRAPALIFSTLYDGSEARADARLIGNRLNRISDFDFLRYIYNCQHPLEKNGT